MDTESFYRNMLHNLYEGLSYVDDQGVLTFWNKGAERISGFSVYEMVGRREEDSLLSYVDEAGTVLSSLVTKTRQENRAQEGTGYLLHRMGHRTPITIRTLPIREEETLIGVLEVFTDFSEVYERIEDLSWYKVIATKDQITGLTNRRYAEPYAVSRIEKAQKENSPLALVLFDVDDFKRVNRSYGYAVGHEVFGMVADILAASSRTKDFVARYYEDTFLGLYPALDEEGLARTMDQIRDMVFQSDLWTKDHTVNLTLSIGATLIREEESLETALSRVETLLLHSKKQGGNQVTLG